MAKAALFLLWASISIFTRQVAADGTGILGAGKWLYRPTCAHSCRRFIIDSPLVCDGLPDDHATGGHSHSATTSKKCYLSNVDFLRTMALCLDAHCMRDDVSLSDLQSYWERHLATGTLADKSLTPVLTYPEALTDAKREQSDRELAYVVTKQELNQTMLVREDDFVPMYNYQKSFEWGEVDHGRNSIVVTVTAVGIPILMSLSALLPSKPISRIALFMDQPLFGHSYRVSFQKSGIMPTRAQGLFLAYLVIINMVLTCLPLRILQPNARQPGADRQASLIIGDRAGVLAAANLVPLLLTSSRNNVLLWLTNWSQTTFLLLHRWLGYIVIIQTVVHSAGLLHVFLKWDDHSAESQLPYWYWGIVSTLAICLIGPLSILPLRQRVYEIFLATHQLLAALAMISYFLHIWYLYQYNWGYELWVYIAGAIWGLDRLLRVLNIVKNGQQTAVVSTVGPSSDLLRIDIEGSASEGHVYLYFPTLTWRFWENHPFSVLSSFRCASEDHNVEASDTGSTTPDEKAANATARVGDVGIDDSAILAQPCTTLLLRPQNGTTLKLLQRTRAEGGSLRIPVGLESSYHSQSTSSLRRCSTLICIAGGVGITAVIPLLRSFPGPEARLYWSVKHDDIVRAINPEMRALGDRVKTEIMVGQRLQIDAIVQAEILNGNARGDIGVVVCGPAAMADHVRAALGKVAGRSKRGIVFIDEAFSW